MSEAANSLIQATVEHLGQFAPFDQMAREHLLWMARKLTLGYFAKGEVILSPGQTDPVPCLIIKQGIVQGEQGIAQTQEDSAWLELHEGECFPLGALLADRPVTSVYRASSDVFCYALPAGDFLQLTRLSAAFHDFCTRRIANLLEQSKHLIQAGYSKASSEQQSMSSSLASVIRREPVTCAPDTSIRQALQRMEDHGVGAMVAVESRVPKGILTLHDVLSRVALAGMDLDEPVIRIMSTNLITLPPHAAAHEAALAMAKQGIRHVLVTDSGRLTGVISEKDLFSLQRVGLSRISTAIRHAPDLALLKQCARDIQQLARNMLAQGVAAEQLTQIITTLNDLLTTRIIELELQESPARGIEFCWLALGSEGRFEQTLNTDQDNGIIFALKDNQDPAALRAVLLPLPNASISPSRSAGFRCAAATSWRRTRNGACRSMNGRPRSTNGSTTAPRWICCTRPSSSTSVRSTVRPTWGRRCVNGCRQPHRRTRASSTSLPSMPCATDRPSAWCAIS